jgi:hypothetical protein
MRYGSDNQGVKRFPCGVLLVSTLRCVQAGGQTAYANALDAAKAELDAHGRPGVQKMIVIRLGLDRLRPGRSRRPDCGKQGGGNELPPILGHGTSRLNG